MNTLKEALRSHLLSSAGGRLLAGSASSGVSVCFAVACSWSVEVVYEASARVLPKPGLVVGSCITEDGLGSEEVALG